MRRSSSLAMLALLVFLVTACSSGKGDEGLTPASPSQTEAPSPDSFSVTTAAVESPAPPPPAFPDDVKAKVTATLDRYLQEAVLGPLRSGQAGDLGAVFTGRAKARVDGPDRAALVDEGLPRARAVKADAAKATLAALTAADQGLAVVTAAIEVRLKTEGDETVTLERTGQLVLVPDGDGWKIDGYDVRTVRDTEGGATTTTAHG